MIDEPLVLWIRECEMAASYPTGSPPEMLGDLAIEAAERLLAVARVLADVACRECDGYGHKTYGSTATWSGRGGGQAITRGVCDVCWGTGRRDEIGVDLRKLRYSANRTED